MNTVHCGPTVVFLTYGAIVFPKDHTSPLVSNTKEALTSCVKKDTIKRDSNGTLLSFETENSLYIVDPE